MGTKREPGEFDCYASAEPDEPLFVLLARDKHAPTLLWLWAVLRELDGEDPKKVNEARDCCVAMLHWAKDHGRPAVGLGQAVLAGVLELIRSVNAHAKDAANLRTPEDLLRQYLAETQFDQDKAQP